MIIALNTSQESGSILASLRAGINEYLFPPLEEPLKKALEKRSVERSRRRDGGAKGGGKALGFLSAKGGCGATTLVCHVAAELGRLNQKVLLTDLDMDAGMVGFITKTKSVYSILDAVNNLHRLDLHNRTLRSFCHQAGVHYALFTTGQDLQSFVLRELPALGMLT